MVLPIICWKARHYELIGARYGIEHFSYFGTIITLLGFRYFRRTYIRDDLDLLCVS